MTALNMVHTAIIQGVNRVDVERVNIMGQVMSGKSTCALMGGHNYIFI